MATGRWSGILRDFMNGQHARVHVQVDSDGNDVAGNAPVGVDPESGGLGMLGFLGSIYKHLSNGLPPSLGQKDAAHSLSVALASDQSLNATFSGGTVAVSALPALPAGGNAIGSVSVTGTPSVALSAPVALDAATIAAIAPGAITVGAVAQAAAYSSFRTYSATSTPGRVSATWPADSVLVENPTDNTLPVYVGSSAVLQPTKLYPGESVTMRCTDVMQIYARTDSGASLISLIAEIPGTPGVPEDVNIVSRVASHEETLPTLTLVSGGAVVSANVDAAIVGGEGLRLYGYTVNDQGAGCSLALVAGATALGGGTPIAYITAKPGKITRGTFNVGGVSATAGISVLVLSGSFTLTLRTKVA